VSTIFTSPYEALSLGAEFVSPERVVTEANVIAFAELTGDHHPQHVDAHWAESSIFGEQIAHGLLVLSLAMGLAPIDPENVLALRRLRDVVFKRPVAFGDVMRARLVVRDLTRLSPDRGLVALRLVVTVNGSTAIAAVLDVFWRCEAADLPHSGTTLEDQSAQEAEGATPEIRG
jgi:3-hydroxybutyryl-CoA dehydratase